RVALGHVAGALLVPRQDVPDRRALREGVVGRENRAAGEPEDGVDALGLERAEERVCSCHLLRHAVPPRANSVSRRADGSIESTTSTNSRVVAATPAGAMSGVLRPEDSTSSTLRSSVSAAARRPRPSPSMSEAARSISLGFATPWPAMSSADPWLGPNRLGPLGERRPVAVSGRMFGAS